MRKNHAHFILLFIVVGVVAGIGSGWYFGKTMTSVGWMGELFMNSLKMCIVPLLAAAVISGVTSMSRTAGFGRVGGAALLYYISTTAVAVFIGLVVVNIIKPGEGLVFKAAEESAHMAEKAANSGITDILLHMVSPNVVKSAADGQMLPIITFSILFAVALSMVGKKADPVIAFFDGLNEAMMKIVVWIMYFAPLGIFGLVANRLGQAGGGEAFMAEIKGVGWYMATVILALGVHFVVLFLVLYFVTGQGVAYYLGMFRALFTAFGTASSSATLPVTMECAKENGIGDRAVKFILPLGSTVNMDGTALYESVAAMFIAQAYGFDMTINQQVIIFITATLAAVGAAGIPEAGLITMIIVLQSVGLPTEGIALLLAVDWFLDRCRTSLNVWGDAVGAAVIDSVLPDGSEDKKAA